MENKELLTPREFFIISFFMSLICIMQWSNYRKEIISIKIEKEAFEYFREQQQKILYDQQQLIDKLNSNSHSNLTTEENKETILNNKNN